MPNRGFRRSGSRRGFSPGQGVALMLMCVFASLAIIAAGVGATGWAIGLLVVAAAFAVLSII